MVKPPYVNTVPPFPAVTQYFPDGSLGFSSGTPVTSRSGSLTSVSTPGFRTIPRSQLPWHNFDYNYTQVQYFPGDYGGHDAQADRYVGYRGYCYGNIPASFNDGVTFELDDDIVRKAEQKALLKVKDMSVNLAQAFGERQQTLNMLTKTVKRVAQAAHALRQGNVVNAAYQLGVDVPKLGRRPRKGWSFSSLWLELQYGWKPLLSDVRGAAEKIAQTYAFQKPFEVHAKAEHLSKRYNVKFRDAPTISTRTRMVFDASSSEKARVVLQYEMENDLAAALSTTGITDPALLAWELLPYSFVVDWFLPVGNYLQALGATQGFLFRRGTKSYSRTSYAHTYWVNASRTFEDGSDVHIGGCTFDVKVEVKYRQLYQDFPQAALLRGSGLGTERALSAISLLRQAFKR